MDSPFPSTAPFPLAGEAAALLSSVFWAGAGVVFATLRTVPAAALNLGKNATATACFAVLLVALGGSPWPGDLSFRAHALLAASGLLGLSACDTLFLRALHGIGPRRASLVFMLAPVLVFLVAWFPPFRQTGAASEPLTWVGLALAFAGIAGAAGEGRASVPVPRGDGRGGVGDAFGAAVLQAAGTMLARGAFEEGAGPLEGAYLRLLWGTVGLLAVAPFGPGLRWARALSHRRVLVRLGVAAFFGTFLGIGLNQAGIAWAASTGVAATINSLSPVWLIPLSYAFLGERHGVRAWLSTLLAVAGVALLSL